MLGGIPLARGKLPYRVLLEVRPEADGSHVAVSLVDEALGLVRIRWLQEECQGVFDDLVGVLRSTG
ncbi:MAG: hypothetical protein ACRDZO_07440 [Egibacteraceae bacterium]